MRDDTIISILAVAVASALTSLTSTMNKRQAGVVLFHKVFREKVLEAGSGSTTLRHQLSLPHFLFPQTGITRLSNQWASGFRDVNARKDHLVHSRSSIN